MKKFFFPALALLLSYPTIANAQNHQNNFEYEGRSYSYTVKDYGDYLIINGVEVNSGKSFRLRVGESRVRGTMGARSVNFPLSGVKPMVAATDNKENIAVL